MLYPLATIVVLATWYICSSGSVAKSCPVKQPLGSSEPSEDDEEGRKQVLPVLATWYICSKNQEENSLTRTISSFVW
jgi:hypothetical protein